MVQKTAGEGSDLENLLPKLFQLSTRRNSVTQLGRLASLAAPGCSKQRCDYTLTIVGINLESRITVQSGASGLSRNVCWLEAEL